MNFVVMPIIHFCYPETARRSLEEIDLLFASDSILVKSNMQEHDRRLAAAGGNIAVAARTLLDEVNGETYLDPRRASVDHTIETGKASLSSGSNHMDLSKEKGHAM